MSPSAKPVNRGAVELVPDAVNIPLGELRASAGSSGRGGAPMVNANAAAL